jgi:DNA-binding CsgD family transcriptional regulator
MFGLVRQIDIDNQFLFVNDVKTYKLYNKLKLLTNRERQCIEYLLIGKTAKETAKILNLSHRTIEYYFENIKNKLGGCQKRDLRGCI